MVALIDQDSQDAILDRVSHFVQNVYEPVLGEMKKKRGCPNPGHPPAEGCKDLF